MGQTKKVARVPAAPIRRLIERWSANETDVRALLGFHSGPALGNTGKIACLTGLKVDQITKLRSDETRLWLDFDVADRIVTCLYGPLEWHRDPELEAIYQEFDLCALDEARPTTRIA